ncbi:MAG: 1-acyl-sn-glycerol-3-phosphate acyltransferase, partial [Pseudomonadota bacterium]
NVEDALWISIAIFRLATRHPFADPCIGNMTMEIQSASSTFNNVLTGNGTAVSEFSDLHIVDQLIAERGRTLVKHPSWPLLKPMLYRALQYRQAVKMADDVQGASGTGCFEYVSQMLGLDVHVHRGERIPAKGGFILISNHPTGIADGIAVFDLMKRVRNDLVFFANRDAIRVNKNLAEIIIPVEWRTSEKSHAKSRETLVRTNRAFKDERAIALFPSGRIAYWQGTGIKERPWQATGIQLAKRYNVPIIPMNMQARNSWLFYLLAHRNPELRDMTVFHELLNKKGKRFDMTIGRPISPDVFEGDVQDETVKLQDYCEHALKANPDAQFTL